MTTVTKTPESPPETPPRDNNDNDNSNKTPKTPSEGKLFLLRSGGRKIGLRTYHRNFD